MDSGLRRYDGGGAGWLALRGLVGAMEVGIPAFAGMTGGAAGNDGWGGGNGGWANRGLAGMRGSLSFWGIVSLRWRLGWLGLGAIEVGGF